MSKVTAIVLAAGQGKRMNTHLAKQYLSLKDKPVIYYSLKAFEDSVVDDIILVAGNGQIDYCKSEIVEKYQLKKVAQIIEGGLERYDSVYHALMHTEASDYVLIHDGARPFITREMIDNITICVKEENACIFGTPVKETIKVVSPEGIITTTPNRNTLWAAQTPQAFEYTRIKKAYDMLYKDNNRNKIVVTDDAMVYENYRKEPVKMLMGDYNNIKLTTPGDLILAEEILKHLLCEKKEQFFRE